MFQVFHLMDAMVIMGIALVLTETSMFSVGLLEPIEMKSYWHKHTTLHNVCIMGFNDKKKMVYRS